MKEITEIYKKVLFNFKSKINIDKELLDNKSLDELFNYFGTDKGTKVINPFQWRPHEGSKVSPADEKL